MLHEEGYIKCIDDSRTKLRVLFVSTLTDIKSLPFVYLVALYALYERVYSRDRMFSQWVTCFQHEILEKICSYEFLSYHIWRAHRRGKKGEK